MSTSPAPAPAKPPAATVEDETDASVQVEAAENDKDTNEKESLSEDEIKAKVAALVAEGKKAVALKQWEEGEAKYSEALEAQRQLVGDYDIAMAPLLYSYGRALYELVLTQQGVMGKEEVAKNTNTVKDEAAPSNPAFVFGGDGDDDDEDEDEEGEGNGDGEGAPEAADPDEPEDDFNAAWDVLDVARTIYMRELDKPDLPQEKIKATRLMLADCYLSLGDVSLETENFPQAVQDYTSAVEIQTALLPASSRALASSHYQLATVYEFAPAGRASALKHVQAALDGFKLRAKDIVAAEAGKVESEDVGRMSAKERENEARDVAALIGDLEVKIEELNAAPPGTDFVAESIKHLLGGGIGAPSAPAVDSAPVNDLTTMVRRKKKPAPPPAPASSANGADKRPADEAAGGAPKKPRTE